MYKMTEHFVHGLGTVNHFKFYGDSLDGVIDKIVNKMNLLEDRFSYYKRYSDIGKLNSMAGKEFVKVCPEVYEVITEAIRMNNVSTAFNPLIRPILNKWYEVEENYYIDQDDFYSLVDIKSIHFKDRNQIMLSRKGQRIDLGGIAKGYIADNLLIEAKKMGVKQAIVNLGGDTTVFSKEDQSFIIGIKDPFTMKEEFAVAVSLTKGSLSTSGIYERFNPKIGMDANHLVNIHKNKPVINNLISVSVIAESAMKADAYATIFHVIGIEKSIDLLKEIHAEALFITKKNEVLLTQGFAESVVQTSKKMNII